MKKHIINQPVAITAVEFDKHTRAFPRQMEFDGRTYDFIDRGFACTVTRGKATTQILTLSDGHSQFWLRRGDRGIWTLLGMCS
jgi:hypothetical protein